MLKMKTAILCRTNAPLVKCAFDLIKRKIKVQILGRDVAKSLKDTVAEIMEGSPLHTATAEDFLEALDKWLDALSAKLASEDKNQTLLTEAGDRYGCLIEIAKNCNTLSDIIVKIDSFFVDTDNGDVDVVTLCSGHRSKGLEYPRVIVIRPDLLPHPSASRPEDKAQEANLKYVILTRPMHELIICKDKQPI